MFFQSVPPFFFWDLGSSLVSLLWLFIIGNLPMITWLLLQGFILFLHLGHISLLSHFAFRDCGFCSAGCSVVVLSLAVCPLVIGAVLCRLPGGRDWFLTTDGQNWVLSIWWAGPCQGMWLLGSCVLRKTLNSLFAHGLDCVPPLAVWPEASNHWSLQAVGWDQVLVRKRQLPRGLMPVSIPQNYYCSVFVPVVSHSHPPIL